jgi:hypothetical protein
MSGKPATMKFKRFIYVGLVLGGSLFGCYIAWGQYVKSFARRLHPPSSEQVRKWAGLSESGHLTMTTLTNVSSDGNVGFNYNIRLWGKFTSLWAYENCRGTSTNYVVIAVYTPGVLLTTNRTAVIDSIEQMNAQVANELSKLPVVPRPRGISGEPASPRQDLEEMKRATAQVTMSNGEKSYGFTDAVVEMDRFAFHPKFDVLVYEFVRPESSDVHHPPADEVDKLGAQQLYELFTNVDAFLKSQ